MEERLERVLRRRMVEEWERHWFDAEANRIDKWVIYLGQSKKISGLKILFQLICQF